MLVTKELVTKKCLIILLRLQEKLENAAIITLLTKSRKTSTLREPFVEVKFRTMIGNTFFQEFWKFDKWGEKKAYVKSLVITRAIKRIKTDL